MTDEERQKKLEAMKKRGAQKKDKGVLETVFQSPINYAKTGAEAVAQTHRSLTDPAWRKALKARIGIGGYDDMSLDELNQVGSDQTSFVMDPEKIKDSKSIVQSGIKDTAGTMAWLTPTAVGGGAAKAVPATWKATKAAVPFIQGGMVSGGMTGFAQSDEDLFSNPLGVAQDTGVGAGAGGVVSGILHGAGQLLTKGTKKIAGKIYENIIKEPSKNLTKRAIRSGTRLGTEAMEAGAGKGITKQQIYDNALNEINKYEDVLQTELSKYSAEVVPISQIKDATKDLIKKYADAGNTSAVKNITDRITALEAQHGDNIPISVANGIKRTLYDEIRDSAYGQVSTESKEGLKAIARAIKEDIAKKVAGADEINKALGLHGRVADSMEEALTKSQSIGGWRDVIFGGLGGLGGGPTGIVGGIAAQRALTSTPAQKAYANTLQGVSTAATKTGKYVGAPITKAATVFGSGLFSPSRDVVKDSQNQDQTYGEDNNLNHTQNTIPTLPESQPPAQPALEQQAPTMSQPQNIQGIIDSAAEKYAPGDQEFKKVLHAIAMAESGGNPGAVGDGGNSIGLFQNNMAGGRGAGHSPQDLMDPVYNADISAADLVNHYRQGVAQGLSGPNLVAYVSRNGQRPAAGNEMHAARNYGMIAGADTPVSMNVDPSRQMPGAQFSGNAQQASEPGRNLLADASGASPTVDLSETVTITNRNTGEQKSVRRSDLPQYGLPTTYKSQAAAPAPASGGTTPGVQGLPPKEVIDREIVRARMMGTKDSIKAAENLEKLREDYYPEGKKKEGKELSGPNAVLFNKADSAIKAVDRITDTLFEDPNAIIKRTLMPWDQTGRKIGADVASAIDILGYFRTGAAITKEQRADYVYMFPSILDDEATKARKLEILREEFKGYKDLIEKSKGTSDIQFQSGQPTF